MTTPGFTGKLLEPFTPGDLTLKNRVVMAPKMRSQTSEFPRCGDARACPPPKP